MNDELAPFHLVGILRRVAMRKKDIPVSRVEIKKEGRADQTGALDADQGRGGQVQIGDYSVWIETEIGNRGEVVEIDVFLAGCREFRLRPSELLILHFELDLVYLEFLDEPFCIDREHPAKALFCEDFFCLRA